MESAISFLKPPSLEKSSKIHSRIKAGDLVSVTVEWQRRTTMILADASFARLAPARMIDGGVNVRIKAVLVGRRDIPGSRRLFLGQTNIHDRFDPFETVFP